MHHPLSYRMESWLHVPCIHIVWPIRLSRRLSATIRLIVSLVVTVRLANMIAEGDELIQTILYLFKSCRFSTELLKSVVGFIVQIKIC